MLVCKSFRLFFLAFANFMCDLTLLPEFWIISVTTFFFNYRKTCTKMTVLYVILESNKYLRFFF
jgi:hypothetical protein